MQQPHLGPVHPMGVRPGFRPDMMMDRRSSMPQQQQPFGQGFGGYTRQPYRSQSSYHLVKDTLVVDKIPSEFCNLEKVNEFFKKFGNLVNIKIDPRGQNATIQFENKMQAEAARDCPDVIFGNRFVKVYFLREYENEHPQNGNGPTGEEGMYGQTVKSDSAVPSNVNYPPVELPKTPQQIALERSKKLLELQKAQESLIAKQIEEQKKIMQQLTSSKSMAPAEKKVLLGRLKELSSSTENLVSKTTVQTQIVAQATASATASNPTPKPLVANLDKEKERLDRELDLLNQIASKAGDADKVDPALQAKLEALKQEAKALGLSGMSPMSTPRGRGRGRGGLGRGGLPTNLQRTRSFNLDNRVKTIKVTGTGGSFLEALREHCLVSFLLW
jgi:RNA-binding protein 26